MAEQSNGNGKQAVASECPKCKGAIQFTPPTWFQVVNDPTLSVLVLPHRELVTCPHCTAVFGFAINSELTSVELDLVCIKEPERRILTSADLIGGGQYKH